MRKHGKSHSKYTSTKIEAEEELVYLRARLSGQEMQTAPQKIMLKDYLREYAAHRSHELRQSTKELYDHYVARINGALGHLPLKQVAVGDIRNFFRHLHDTGLSLSVRRKIFQLLKGMFRDAHGQDYIEKDPMNFVDSPKGHTDSPAQAWTENEVCKFLETAKGHRLYANFYVLLVIGLRIGELSALTWSDFKNNKLTVNKTAQYLKTGLEIGETKNKNGKRTILLPPDVIKVLKEHREQQADEFDVAGKQVKGNLIFPNINGEVLQLKSFTYAFNRLIEEAGVKRIRVHDMRHTCATLSIKRGVPIWIVAERLGHDPVTLMRTYNHIDDEQRERHVLGLNQLTGSPRHDLEREGIPQNIMDTLRKTIETELVPTGESATTVDVDELITKISTKILDAFFTLLGQPT